LGQVIDNGSCLRKPQDVFKAQATIKFEKWQVTKSSEIKTNPIGT